MRLFIFTFIIALLIHNASIPIKCYNLSVPFYALMSDTIPNTTVTGEVREQQTPDVPDYSQEEIGLGVAPDVAVT